MTTSDPNGRREVGVTFDPPGDSIGTAQEVKGTHPFRFTCGAYSLRLTLGQAERLRRDIAVALDRYTEWKTQPPPLVAWKVVPRHDPTFLVNGWLPRLHYAGNDRYRLVKKSEGVFLLRIDGGEWTRVRDVAEGREICERHAAIEQQRLSASGGVPVPEQRPGASASPPDARDQSILHIEEAEHGDVGVPVQVSLMLAGG
jgi:hypothetical protein